MESIGIGDYVESGLTLFGKEVNANRQLVLELDGLKPIYRRLIYTALQYPDRMVKSATLVGDVIGKLHPHGTASAEPVVSALVRWGIFDGQGNYGAKMLDGDDLEPAASRYTEAKISTKWRDILADYMGYVPYKEAEIEGYKEPCYLPTPIPLSLAFGSLGIGFGVNMRLPSFTIKSMYQALINDDPYLLEAPFGLTLSKTEGLKDLWTRGLGELEYKYKVYDTALDSGYGTIIEGDPELFKPNLSVFDPWIQQGRVYKINLTKDIGKIFIGRTYNVKAISLDDISDMANKAAIYKKTFRLTVSDGERSYLIPLKNWLINCYNNYYKIVERFRLDNIEKLKFDHLVYSYLHPVVEILYNHRDFNDTDIYNELSKSHDDITIEVIQAILRKNISTIRNTDSTAKLQKIQDKLNYFETLDITNKIKSLIDEF